MYVAESLSGVEEEWGRERWEERLGVRELEEVEVEEAKAEEADAGECFEMNLPWHQQRRR
jgi:hypothetical protein